MLILIGFCCQTLHTLRYPVQLMLPPDPRRGCLRGAPRLGGAPRYASCRASRYTSACVYSTSRSQLPMSTHRIRIFQKDVGLLIFVVFLRIFFLKSL